MSINCVNISGNVGRNPQLRTTTNGSSTLSFSVCVNDRKKNDNGEWVDVPNWVDVVVFGAYAEHISKYVHKGTKVAVQGRLHQNDYKDGERTRYRLEVVASQVEWLSRSEAAGGAQTNNTANHTEKPQNAPQNASQGAEDIYDDDMPF